MLKVDLEMDKKVKDHQPYSMWNEDNGNSNLRQAWDKPHFYISEIPKLDPLIIEQN